MLRNLMNSDLYSKIIFTNVNNKVFHVAFLYSYISGARANAIQCGGSSRRINYCAIGRKSMSACVKEICMYDDQPSERFRAGGFCMRFTTIKSRRALWLTLDAHVATKYLHMLWIKFRATTIHTYIRETLRKLKFFRVLKSGTFVLSDILLAHRLLYEEI